MKVPDSMELGAGARATPGRRIPAGALAISAIVAFAYHLYFLFRSSFVVDGRRIFCLMDDAMVSMCYARNIALGNGPVWFPGQDAVEGFSNPLWMMLMAIPHALGISRDWASLPVQLLGSLLLLGAGLFAAGITRKLLPRHANLASVAVFLLVSLNFSLVEWSLGGMETSAVVSLVAAGCWLFVCRPGTEPWIFGAIYFLGFWLRMDFAIYAAAFAAALCLADRERMGKHAAMLFLGCGGAFLAQLFYRLPIYGEFFPNTYFLKANGAPLLFRVSKGLVVLAYVAFSFGPLAFIAAGVGLAATVRKVASLFLALLGMTATYILYVGGDAWEEQVLINRFLAPVFPLFAVLIVCGMVELATSVGNLFPWHARKWRQPCAIVAIAVVGLMLHGRLSLGQMTFLRAVQQVLQLDPYAPRRVASDFARENRDNVLAGKLLQEALRPGARVITYYAGVPVYFSDGLEFVDALGKNDRHIARVKGKLEGTLGRLYSYRPGHVKHDANYTINEFNADASHRGIYDREFARLVAEKFHRMEVPDTVLHVHFRRNSPNVRWNLLPEFER